MFDKIAIINNKIKIAKSIISWENSNSTVNDEKSRPSHKFTRLIFDEKDAAKLIESLEKRGIHHKIEPIDIPQSVLQYENREWFAGKDDAVYFINNITEYNFDSFNSEELLQELQKTDYKAIKYAEGLISEKDYILIKLRRQLLRDEINKRKRDIL